MIDFAEIRLFVKDEFVISDKDNKQFLLSLNLLELGVTVGSRDVYLDEQGNMQVGALYHPYDDLPTSFTNVAFKLVHAGKIKPHVMIKCSPAKIMQGHNIFGSDNLELGIFEMLGFLAESNPKLYDVLDVPNAQIVNLDVTYSARLRNDDQVLQVLDFLRKVSSGSLRKSKLVYGSTVYWGSPNSKRLARKAYCKSIEFQLQLSKLKRQAAKGESFAMRVIKAMEDPRVIAFMQGLLRLETRFKPLWLTEHNIPLNIFDLIKHQQANPNFLSEIWQLANKPLFEALEGHTMKALDHDTVFAKICSQFDTYTKSGRLSQTKSRNIFNFFCALEMHGSEIMKKKYSETRYYAYLKDLRECGFSKAYLQNLDSESKNNVIPFVQLVKIDFQNQVPDWYQEPISRFAKVG
ncbi:DNA replication protein [Acinetobacter sp. S40]|uniref:phage/plasmid replication protein, II/X family n=1 Tax=Acinetobacter sp. S40 TaxID=2767434 RepID=UPI00190B9F56|nr:phage/plasmid replication protein, II/X family [Acinetobacter sp. S40]MBJ9987009.1 DNA replication protein [Acinetobacter sp. S40]